MIVDSHCHLDFSDLFNQLDSVLSRADKNNIKKMLTICTTLESFKKIKIIIEKYDTVYGTVGIHPHEVKNFSSINSELLSQFKKEHKMSGDGTYDEWKEKKIVADKLAWIRDQKIMIKEFKEQDTPEFYQQFRPDGHSVDREKWNIDKTTLIEQADEALEFLEKMEDSLK